jgi:hypothetical protein
MKYDISNLDLLSIDAKKLDVCNDAKYELESKIPKRPACCLYCKWFAALYEGSCNTLGVCIIHNRVASFYKSLVPGWGVCDYYETDELKLLQEAENG